MRIVVCDDDKDCCQWIKNCILSNLEEKSESVVDICNSATELLSFSNRFKLDILFLDIELGDINGIELAKMLRKKFSDLIIIYVTNHPNYVFSCFETEPLNFVRKPIDRVKFDYIFGMAIKKYNDIHKFIPIKWQNDSVNIEINDICYIEGYHRHLTFHLFNGEQYEIVGKISSISNELKTYDFIKIHQGYIVNMLHIKNFGETDVYMKNDAVVPMSVRKKLVSKEAYSNYINRRY